MTSSHSYSAEFYVAEGADPYDPNTWGERCNLLNQLARMAETEEHDYSVVCGLAGIDPHSECALWELVRYVKETVNTVNSLHGMGGVVTVWLEPEGEYTVEVCPNMWRCPNDSHGCNNGGNNVYSSEDVQIKDTYSACRHCGAELSL